MQDPDLCSEAVRSTCSSLSPCIKVSVLDNRGHGSELVDAASPAYLQRCIPTSGEPNCLKHKHKGTGAWLQPTCRGTKATLKCQELDQRCAAVSRVSTRQARARQATSESSMPVRWRKILILPAMQHALPHHSSRCATHSLLTTGGLTAT
eukprot:6473517-Amphidinium_carterae.1